MSDGSTGSIRVLPHSLVQHMRSAVAASDIIHVVEDLVLNSIDAGATAIAVKVSMTRYL